MKEYISDFLLIFTKIQEEGEIEKDNKVENVRKEPLPLLDSFEWTDFDLNNPDHLDEVWSHFFASSHLKTRFTNSFLKTTSKTMMVSSDSTTLRTF